MLLPKKYFDNRDGTIAGMVTIKNAINANSLEIS